MSQTTTTSFVRSLHHFDIYKKIYLPNIMFKGQHICDEISFLFILNDSCTSVKVFNDTIVQVPGRDSWANLVVSVFKFRLLVAQSIACLTKFSREKTIVGTVAR